MPRAIVIGMGNAGERHVSVYRQKGFDMIGVDTDNSKGFLWPRQEKERASDPRMHITYEGLEADYLSVCSYDRDHAEQVVWGLQHDMNVFCEKPLCQNEKELEKIETALKKSKGRLSCNLPLRFHPEFMEIKSDISSGKIGTPYLIEADYQYGRLHKITDGWRGEDPFYSVVLGGGVHMVDLAQWMAGEKIVKVQAVGNNFNAPNIKTPDTIVAMGTFENGCLFKMTCNFGFNGHHRHDFTVHGTEGKRIYYSRRPVKKDGPLREFISDKEPTITPEQIFDGMRACFAIDWSHSMNVPATVM